MRRVAAQVSLYPLGRAPLGPSVEQAIETLRRRGLEVRVGEMSTLVSGPSATLFSALHTMFEEASAQGDVVLVITVSNACPGTGEDTPDGRAGAADGGVEGA
jgi:uncharacterized protein YqgV (UPF0045/DUF77 family)